jgi:ATP-dependent DNA helicase RecG
MLFLCYNIQNGGNQMKSYLKKGEGKTIEFKETLPSKNQIAKTVVAFSNTAGGKIILGIEDKSRTVKGISDDQVMSWPDLISNVIYDQCYPNIIPEISIIPFEEKNLLMIEIFPGALKPYYLKKKGRSKGVYIRVGASNRMADDDMIQELERQRMNISYDEQLLHQYTPQDLNQSKLTSDFKQLTGKILAFSDFLNLKLIKKEQQDHPTIGGMLIAPQKELPEFEYACIKAARFKGNDMDEIIDHKEFRGALYDQVNMTMNFARQYIAKNGKIIELQRIDQYEIPLPAIREALINAVVHRDYSIKGSDIKFAIFDDRIEITSPGALPKSIEINDIIAGRSEIRNIVIARFFKEINYIEQWGTGIQKMMRQCEAAGLRSPHLIESGLFFKIIFFKPESAHMPTTPQRPDTTLQLPDTTPQLPDTTPQLPDTTPQLSDTTPQLPDTRLKQIENYPEKAKKIIEYIHETPDITRKELAFRLGITENGVKYHIKNLTQDGVIKRIGKKWFFWKDFQKGAFP